MLPFVLLLALTIALTATGCRSSRAEATLNLPAELTATAEAQAPETAVTPRPALTPVATASPAPAAGPTSTATPASASDAVAAVARFLDEQRWSGATLETMLMGLDQALAPAGVQAQALAVPPRDSAEVPVLLVAYRPAGSPLVKGHAILWWQGGELRQQDFPLEPGATRQDSDSFGPDSTFVAARQQLRDGKPELGLVYGANSGGSAWVQVYRLLRLEDGKWCTLWDGLRDGREQWKTSHASASFEEAAGAGVDALATVTVRSSSWLGDDGKGGFFHESNPGPHRYFVDTWARQGDRYVLSGSRTEPSAYATLVEFVCRLSRGEESAAAGLVADPRLIERAKALGLVDQPAAPGWLIDLDSPEVERRGPITIVDGPAVTIFFEERAGQWLIKEIVSP